MAEIQFTFYQCINTVFTISAIFGIPTFSVTKTHIIKPNTRLFCSFVLLFGQVALVTYSSYLILNNNATIISKLTDIILLVLLTLYVINIWFFSMYYQKCHINFILKIIEYDKRFKEIYSYILYYKSIKTFIKHRFIYYISFSIIFIVLLGEILVNSFNAILTVELLCYILPVILTVAFSIQFTTYLKIIKSRLQYLNNDIKEVDSLTLASKVYPLIRLMKQVREQSKNITTALRQMSMLHHQQCGQITALMGIYGIMILGMIVLSFTSTIIGVYYSFCIYRGYIEDMHISQVLAIFFNTEMIFVCHMCGSTVDEVRNNIHIINRAGLLVYFRYVGTYGELIRVLFRLSHSFKRWVRSCELWLVTELRILWQQAAYI